MRTAIASWMPAMRLGMLSPAASLLVTSCSAKTVQVLLISAGLSAESDSSPNFSGDAQRLRDNVQESARAGRALVVHDEARDLAVLYLDAFAVLPAYVHYSTRGRQKAVNDLSRGM